MVAHRPDAGQIVCVGDGESEPLLAVDFSHASLPLRLVVATVLAVSMVCVGWFYAWIAFWLIEAFK